MFSPLLLLRTNAILALPLDIFGGRRMKRCGISVRSSWDRRAGTGSKAAADLLAAVGTILIWLLSL